MLKQERGAPPERTTGREQSDGASAVRVDVMSVERAERAKSVCERGVACSRVDSRLEGCAGIREDGCFEADAWRIASASQTGVEYDPRGSPVYASSRTGDEGS